MFSSRPRWDTTYCGRFSFWLFMYKSAMWIIQIMTAALSLCESLTGSLGITAGCQRSARESNRKYPIRWTSLPCSGQLKKCLSWLLAVSVGFPLTWWMKAAGDASQSHTQDFRSSQMCAVLHKRCFRKDLKILALLQSETTCGPWAKSDQSYKCKKRKSDEHRPVKAAGSWVFWKVSGFQIGSQETISTIQ